MSSVTSSAPDIAATFCATLVDEWARNGITHAFIAPGSRSTPLAVALASDDRLATSIFHDERSASFAAVGFGSATGRPAVVLTTSGTAAAEMHAAVIEAHQAPVPMLVVTADRPPELRDVGAPQTINQVGLYGGSVRMYAEPGAADWAMRSSWRSMASRWVLVASGLAAGPQGARPGPVHVNLAFREPLLGTPTEIPPGRADNAPWHLTVANQPISGIMLDRAQRGLVVAGLGAGGFVRDLRRLGWPVIADPRSGLDGVAHADALLRHGAFGDAHHPDVIVRIGSLPASRVVNEWLAGQPVRNVTIGDGWFDPYGTAAVHAATFEVDTTHAAPNGWLRSWMQADAVAAEAIDEVIGQHREVTEPAVARAVVASAARGSSVVASSSMPIRDIEWYAPRRSDVRVIANRGANGIDGVVSTAIGVALGGARTVALVGDVAFVHDSAALAALARRDINLTVVVVDNDGGGIFSFLPQATTLTEDVFEQLFGTPHGTDCAALARAHGLTVVEADTAVAVSQAVAASATSRGVRVVVTRTDRAANVKVHRDLNAAVAVALDALQIC